MAISFDASVSGMQAATLRQDVTANNVANVNTDGFEQTTAYQTDVLPQGTRISHLARTPNSPTAPSNTDLAKEITEQKINNAAFQADINVIKARDRMMGTILDMFA
jgi:flagellar hook protein FlgE